MSRHETGKWRAPPVLKVQLRLLCFRLCGPKPQLPVASLRTRLLARLCSGALGGVRLGVQAGRAGPGPLRQGRAGAGTSARPGRRLSESPKPGLAPSPPWGCPGRHAKPDSEAQGAGACQYLRGPGEGPGFTAALGQPTDAAVSPGALCKLAACFFTLEVSA